MRICLVLSSSVVFATAAGCGPKPKPVEPPPQQSANELVGSAGTTLIVGDSEWVAIVPRTATGPVGADFEALAADAQQCSQGGCGTNASGPNIELASNAFQNALTNAALGHCLVGNYRMLVAVGAEHLFLTWSRQDPVEAILSGAGMERVGEIHEQGIVGPHCAPCTPNGGGVQPDCTGPPWIPPRITR